MFNTRIDAHIIRAYLDDPAETSARLYLGLIGIGSWESVIGGFDASKLPASDF